MEKEQINNENFIVYAPDSLNFIVDNLEEILDETLKKYKELFDIDKYRKIQINFFDDLNNFREFIYSLRGEKESLPRYAKGTFDNGMINSYIEKDIYNDKEKYHRRLYTASHELFHILYKELIIEKEKINRITWFDEGMAEFFSGEYNNLNNKENFKKWFNKLLNKTKKIPDLNQISHGDLFETKEYSGYDLSLLSVKYLYDLLGIKEFKKLMHNEKEIIKYGNNIVKESFEYYKNKTLIAEE